MPGIADDQVTETLEALASPAGQGAAGVATALAGATAASLVELTAGLAANRVGAEAANHEAGSEARFRALAGRARELRKRVLANADEDIEAYAEVMQASDAPARAQALARASEPPLAIAECAAEIAEAGAEVAAASNWPFRPDAVAAAELARAAALGAARLVAANLTEHAGDPRLARARAAADRAGRALRDTAD